MIEQLKRNHSLAALLTFCRIAQLRQHIIGIHDITLTHRCQYQRTKKRDRGDEKA